MTTYVADHETGNPLCPPCSVSACVGSYECRDEHCRCGCGIDEAGEHRNDEAGRAREVERENRPDSNPERLRLMHDLRRERFQLGGRRAQ